MAMERSRMLELLKDKEGREEILLNNNEISLNMFQKSGGKYLLRFIESKQDQEILGDLIEKFALKLLEELSKYLPIDSKIIQSLEFITFKGEYNDFRKNIEYL